MYFKILILCLCLIFYSCGFLFTKCDYCNVNYKGEEIVYSHISQISYHKTCYDNYFFPAIQQNKTNFIVNNSAVAKQFLNETRNLLNNIGLNITENIEINLADAKDFQVRKG